MMRTLLPLILGSFALTTNAQEQEVDLSWKPEVGVSSLLQMTSDMAIDAGGQAMTIQVQIKIATKIVKVEDGKVTIESEPKSFKMNMNGQVMDSPPGGSSPEGQKVTTVVGIDGTPISSTNTDPMAGGPRVDRLGAFYHPKGTVKVGGEWMKDVPADAKAKVPSGKYKYTLEAGEVVNGISCWRIKYVYSEMEGDVPFGAVGTMWLEQKDRSLVKLDATYENVQYVEMMPPVNAKVTLVRVKE